MPSLQVFNPDYRRDIDGLRAVAVLSVIGFHAFPGWFSGGFIGVDSFFVISGYLISRIIFVELNRKKFSFFDFYSRRINRIFPSLIVVLIACIAFGAFDLLANEYEQLGAHVAGGAAFISNLLLWRESGYFDNAADTKPLLHLWSLGVEEQFYIFWPVLAWAAYKRKIKFISVVIIVVAASFFFNIIQAKFDVIADFYSPLTRFWELMAGSLLAWFSLYKPELCATHSRIKDAISCIGFSILIAGFGIINAGDAFPGAWALFPVIGTVLIIFSGPNAIVNRIILSNRVFVWFGLISFPLYLWHWPLLSFARIIYNDTPGRGIRAMLIVTAIALAWLTYRYVERPLRRSLMQSKTAILFGAMSVVFAIGGVIYLKQGIPARFPIAKYHSLPDDANSFEGQAVANCNARFPTWNHPMVNSPCWMQKTNGNTIALIGDSHARDLYLGMSELTQGDEGVVAFSASCAAPYIGIASATRDPALRALRADTFKKIDAAYNYIFKESSIHTVILAHNPQCSETDVKDVQNVALTDPSVILRSGMKRTFAALDNAGKKTIVVLDVPALPEDPQACISSRPIRVTQGKLQLLETEQRCVFSRKIHDENVAFVNYRKDVVAVAKDFPNVRIIDLADFLCDAKYCDAIKDGELIYHDRDHLTFAGSRYISDLLRKSIAKP